MPEVSYDGRSFTIDGRRIWLVSGTVHYARTPRGLWRDRIRAAKQAGLNCIDTSVVWAAHEQAPGDFDFTGDRDLRAFVQAVADEGMYCILRPGPCIGGGCDFGGLPAYLHGLADGKGNRARIRDNEPLYMEAVDRYLRQVFGQVGDLQASSPAGGPIVLMQLEHAWYSHRPEGSDYLNRLMSMFRQHGVTVPIVNNNNLWQPVEGTIDTWSGRQRLPAMIRQLNVVQSHAPSMVMACESGAQDRWGQDQAVDIGPSDHEYRLGGLIGVGAQFNLHPFHGGTNLGFSAGRACVGDAGYITTSNDCGAPLGEAGQRGEKYAITKRLCTFASQFGHVLAARDSDPAPAIELNTFDHPVSLLNLAGSQGELVMLLKSEKDKTRHTRLVLPNGLSLSVPHAGQRAAWVLLNANLGGAATLDYTSASPWALIDRSLLVVFGPAGETCVISINGEQRSVTIPTGKTPVVLEGDPVHVTVLNHEQVNAATIGPQGLVIGCDGLDGEDNPIPLKGWSTQFTIAPDGGISRKRVTAPRKPTAPKLAKWQTLSLKPLIDGTDEHYEPIDTPADMGELGQSFGYSWYRLNVPKAVSGKALVHEGGDRLHIYQGGKLNALLGKGEGAGDTPTQLKLAGDVVVLADNLGRFEHGQEIGKDKKGLADHLYAVKPIKAGKPQIVAQQPSDPFTIESVVYHGQRGTSAMAEALTWEIKPESRKPVILEIDNFLHPCVVSVNGQPVRYYASALSGGQIRLLLDPADDGPMTGGKNTIKLELFEGLDELAEIDKAIRFYQTTGALTPKDGWSFTPWAIPSGDDEGWRALPKSLPSQPAWMKCTFNAASLDAPLWLESTGLSKGQVVLNGHNLGRYWQQTREGKQVQPDQRLYLPEPWLDPDGPNELMIFDEHGHTPEKCRLAYD